MKKILFYLVVALFLVACTKEANEPIQEEPIQEETDQDILEWNYPPASLPENIDQILTETPLWITCRGKMYAKVKDDINKIEDLKAKNDRLDKALAEYAASLVCDIRGKYGKSLKHDDGTTVTVSDVKEILYEAPVLATAIANFQSNQNNFLQL
jgi:hypothetical protein